MGEPQANQSINEPEDEETSDKFPTERVFVDAERAATGGIPVAKPARTLGFVPQPNLHTTELISN